jgi:hypothetical protein
MKTLTETFQKSCRYLGALLNAPSRKQAQICLFVLGISLIAMGTSQELFAQRFIRFNDARVTESVNGVLTYLEGSFGALVMVAAGIGAIMSAAFGQYRAALALMVVAVGAFILRSLMSTFFNDSNVQS